MREDLAVGGRREDRSADVGRALPDVHLVGRGGLDRGVARREQELHQVDADGKRVRRQDERRRGDLALDEARLHHVLAGPEVAGRMAHDDRFAAAGEPAFIAPGVPVPRTRHRRLDDDGACRDRLRIRRTGVRGGDTCGDRSDDGDALSGCTTRRDVVGVGHGKSPAGGFRTAAAVEATPACCRRLAGRALAWVPTSARTLGIRGIRRGPHVSLQSEVYEVFAPPPARSAGASRWRSEKPAGACEEFVRSPRRRPRSPRNADGRR